MRKTPLRAIFLAILFTLVATAAKAAPIILYDANLTSPSATTDPGFYNGTGNPNGGFTIVQENGIEVALRAKGRQDPNVIHTTNNVYSVPLGSQPGVPTRAWWNHEHSINLQPLEVGDMTLLDILPFSTYTFEDVTAGKTMSVPYPYWLDSATWGPTGEQQFSLGTMNTQWGSQNSGNPVFGDFPLNLLPDYEYNMNTAALFRFTLDVRDPFGDLLASNTIYIRQGDAPFPDNGTTPVPEPATMLTFAAGAAFLSVYRRRRKQARV